MPVSTISALGSARPPRPWLWQALALALLLAPRMAWADDKAAPAQTGNKAGSPSGGNSVADGFRSLGQQLSDPKTLDRIKGHEQELEKNVQSTRDRQRKSHPGELRASDATDMANDPKMGGPGKARGGTKTTTTKAAPPQSSVKGSGGAGAPPAASVPPKAPPPAAVPAR